MPTMDPNKNHSIPLQEASVNCKNYRDLHPDETTAFAISNSALQQIQDQTGCIFTRVYLAIDSAGKLQPVFVGVDKDGNDICSETSKIQDRSYDNPTYNSNPNPLNS